MLIYENMRYISTGVLFNFLQKPVNQIEEIDLVTPVRNETEGFIEHEGKAYRENGSGDYQRNGSSENRYNRSYNSSFKTKGMGRVAPAGYESDLSDDSNELELGWIHFLQSCYSLEWLYLYQSREQFYWCLQDYAVSLRVYLNFSRLSLLLFKISVSLYYPQLFK